MGDFQLGAVLGSYDKRLSFDANSKSLGASGPDGWAKASSQSSNFYSTDVHSSPQGLKTDMFSLSTNLNFLFYSHRVADDLFAREFPDVTTHDLLFTGWARVDQSSGSVFAFGIGNAVFPSQFIPQADELIYYNMKTEVHSVAGTFNASIIFRNISYVDSFSLFTDDIIDIIDPIILHPNYSMEDRAKLRQSNHTTLGGFRQQYSWNKTFEWSVPLSFLSDSHADLINWWWENQFVLAFTLDTSDSESTFLTRIGNARQPIGSRRRSDNKLFEGMLQLEAVTDGRLVF